MLNWIYNKLLRIRNKKQHEIMKLKWEHAELKKRAENIHCKDRA